MRMMRHNSIIVTSFDCFKEDMTKAHEKAVELFGSRVTPIVESGLNGVISFFVATDGSEEGWTDAEAADKKRAKFCKFLDSLSFDNGSSPLAYLDVEYGEEYSGNTAFIARANMKLVEDAK